MSEHLPRRFSMKTNDPNDRVKFGEVYEMPMSPSVKMKVKEN